MTKENIHLSDWIQYLISIKYLGISLGGVMLTIDIALIIALVGYGNSISIEMQITTIAVIWLFIFLTIWLVNAKKSPLNKATRLINEIMKNSNKINVNDIRKKWYDEGKYMINNTEYVERKYLLIGLILGALFGIIGNFMSGYYFWGLEHTNEQWKFWFSLVAFIIVILFSYYIIRKIDNIIKNKNS